jgi:alpha-glucosidase
MNKVLIKLSISLLLLFLFPVFILATGTPETEVRSPDGSITVTVTGGKAITLTAVLNNRNIFTISDPGMIINNKKNTTGTFTVKTRTVNQVQHPVIREKRAVVTDNYNEITLEFRDNSRMIIRAYNDGIAYRFYTRYREDTVQVVNETATIGFAPGDSLYLPIIRCRDEKDVDCFHTSFEEDFVHTAAGEVSPASLAYLPIYARTKNGASIAFTESDLNDYPGMFVSGDENRVNSLSLRFPAYPVSTAVRGEYFKQELVTKRADHIALTAGKRYYPWRVFIIGENDRDLVNSDMVYRLAPECELTETGWIKPGQITDEWIINSILYNVDFKSGINTQTYKYYIDFASRFGLDYIFLDAGWCDVGDFSKLNPEVNVEEIVRYGAGKQVGIWLWTSALTLKNNMSVLEHFSNQGIKGIMVDFMDREDQLMVRYLERVARETAKNRLMVLFHGASKPVGLRKAYPNVISREGVAGHEFDKWTERITPEHNLIIPFTRMIAGPLDYEAGGMINAQKNAFRVVDPVPMTQGTRIHQLGMYIVYESPLQYLAGNISDYIREPEYASFFGKMPTVWDETIVLDGKISDYILVARRNGNDWWVAAMTDWTPRTLDLDLLFLGEGNFSAEIYQDGMNADQYASDYKRVEAEVNPDSKIRITMAPGGGWVGHFAKQGSTE